VFLLFRVPPGGGNCRRITAIERFSGRWRRPSQPPAGRASGGRLAQTRGYVMLPAALEHERLLIAERLLTEIERRHGLPHPRKRDIHPVITDRFLAAYLPEAREGEPAPLALEYAFAPSLKDALRLLQEVVSETADGQGAALYIHDLHTVVTAETNQLH
jgi:hypothetical protein